jgi:two-component system NtrC family response regulator
MSKPKLLIVEDDQGLCAQYRWAFPAFDIRFAHNRTQALALARSEAPCVAIIDLGLLPDPDGVSEGFAILDGLGTQNPDLKVIVATSHDDRAHALRAIAQGAYDFCEKSVEIEVLSSVVARARHLHELEAENRRLAETPTPQPLRSVVAASDAML